MVMYKIKIKGREVNSIENKNKKPKMGSENNPKIKAKRKRKSKNRKYVKQNNQKGLKKIMIRK
jgi:hypothetical protein